MADKQDIYLKTADEAELIEALPFARIDDQWAIDTHDYSLIVIGQLNHDDVVYDEEGEVASPATPIEGFHANLRCTQEIAALIPDNITITPTTPSVTFFE